MEVWLAHPAVQSGAIPFAVALIWGLAFVRLGWYWAGLGLAAGFYASAYVAPGLEFTPLTSTRKIMLLGIAAVVSGLLIDLIPKTRKATGVVVFVAGIAAVAWLVWAQLMRENPVVALPVALGCALYVGWLAAMTESLRDRPAAAASAAVALGFGTGACALFGASALLGQVGFALAAAAGALWLIVVFTRNSALGSLFTLPAGVLAGLIGAGAAIFSKLPWYSLPVLALVPLLARVPPPKGASRLVEGLIYLSICGVAAASAGIIAWRVAGAPPL